MQTKIRSSRKLINIKFFEALWPNLTCMNGKNVIKFDSIVHLHLLKSSMVKPTLANLGLVMMAQHGTRWKLNRKWFRMSNQFCFNWLSLYWLRSEVSNRRRHAGSRDKLAGKDFTFLTKFILFVFVRQTHF